MLLIRHTIGQQLPLPSIFPCILTEAGQTGILCYFAVYKISVLAFESNILIVFPWPIFSLPSLAFVDCVFEWPVARFSAVLSQFKLL